MSLFTAADLTEPLGRTVTVAQAALAERIVWGWLKPVLKLEEKPSPATDEVFAWAVELGAIYLENPSGLSSYQLGAERFAFSAERRAQVLAEAAAGGLPDTAVPAPRGAFPPAQPWPDPTRW